MRNRKIGFGMLAMELIFGFVLSGCATAPKDEQTASNDMSAYLKGVEPRSEDWGGPLVKVYQLNLEFKDEIIAAFSKENFIANRTDTRDWDIDKVVFRYVELVKAQEGGWNPPPKMLQYSDASSTDITDYQAFDFGPEPIIGTIFEQQWDECPMRIEYLGQESPSPALVFKKEERFGRWMYPGYYKRTNTKEGYYQHFHISVDEGKLAFEQTGWEK